MSCFITNMFLLFSSCFNPFNKQTSLISSWTQPGIGLFTQNSTSLFSQSISSSTSWNIFNCVITSPILECFAVFLLKLVVFEKGQTFQNPCHPQFLNLIYSHRFCWMMMMMEETIDWKNSSKHMKVKWTWRMVWMLTMSLDWCSSQHSSIHTKPPMWKIFVIPTMCLSFFRDRSDKQGSGQCV